MALAVFKLDSFLCFSDLFVELRSCGDNSSLCIKMTQLPSAVERLRSTTNESNANCKSVSVFLLLVQVVSNKPTRNIFEMLKCRFSLSLNHGFQCRFNRLASTWWCHALIFLVLALKPEVTAATRDDSIKIHVSRDHADYSSHLPLNDPVIKSFCKNCNLVLSEPELMKFVENFYKSVNQVTSARNRLAYQMECDSCNVILAATEDVPRVVEILASAKHKNRS